MTIARPGASRYHQAPAETAPDVNAPSSIEPHETASGSPRPRNDSVDSDRIATATTSTVLAKMSGTTLGSTCRLTRCQLPAPSARARSTYGRSRTVSVCDRMIRAVPGQDVTPMTMMMFVNDRPRTEASTIASGRNGNTENQPEDRGQQ